MKRIFLTLIISAFGLCAVAQKTQIVIPGNGHIDVEKLSAPSNPQMDVSNLTLSESQVVRSAVFARHGYLFRDAIMRNLFEQTTWYDSLMYARLENSEKEDCQAVRAGDEVDYDQGYIGLTDADRELVKRIDEHIQMITYGDERINPKEGDLYTMKMVINPFQLVNMTDKMEQTLCADGLAIVPTNHQQLFQVYEKNDYCNFPSFVTSDLYLQLFHFYFDSILKDIEEEKFDSIVTSFSHQLYEALKVRRASCTDQTECDAIDWCIAYAAVAEGLSTGKAPQVEGLWKDDVADEISKVNASENVFSQFLGYTASPFGYSLFRPRGHYTRSEKLKSYFRTMMWLQSVPFDCDNAEQLQRSIVLAQTLSGNASLLRTYHAIFDPMTVFMGEPDNVTMLQVADIVKAEGKPASQMFADAECMARIQKNIKATGMAQTRIVPQQALTNPYKVNLMPQRYQPDAEVLNAMVDAVNSPTKRGAPKGLDVMAALGDTVALHVLVDELGEARNWEGYMPALDSMKTRMGEIDWSKTVCNRWLQTLQTLNAKRSGESYETLLSCQPFVGTAAWGKKNLNTALASWAELKHDAILYAKQPVVAECGDGEPPAPVLKGYVEQNNEFWKKAVTMMYTIDETLDKYDLWTEKSISATPRVTDLAEFLLDMSKKETADKSLSENDYSQIEIIGSIIENISLDLARGKDQYLMGWDDIESADKKVACVADVMTCNGLNNPNPSILFEGVGGVQELYVLVNIMGDTYLTRGAVFSYREFEQGIDEQRLTDEEWQQSLESNPDRGTPSWIKGSEVPLEQAPEDNEEVFYSTGC